MKTKTLNAGVELVINMELNIILSEAESTH